MACDTQRAMEWQIHLNTTSDGISAFSILITEWFFPIITFAPSEVKPIMLSLYGIFTELKYDVISAYIASLVPLVGSNNVKIESINR